MRRRTVPFALIRCTAAALAVAAAGCATTRSEPGDPLEPYNRAMFAFNDRVDKAVLRPAATIYDKFAPLPVRAGVGNFFSNIEDLWTGTNNLLQGKASEGLTDFARVLINTTLGIVGVFDIASEMGIERHDEDFGQTLGWWGVGEGAFFVLPIFGPRTVRDAGGLVVDLAATGSWTGNDPALQSGASVLRLVHTRANLLAADKVLDEGALDRYTYVREAYLQRRRYEVFDGRPPRPPEEDWQSSAPPALRNEPVAWAAVGALGRLDWTGPVASVPDRPVAAKPELNRE